MVPSGVMAMSTGSRPTVSVSMTVLVAVARTLTELLDWFTTYARAPSGVMANPTGSAPTGTVATTALLTVLITLTVLSTLFAT